MNCDTIALDRHELPGISDLDFIMERRSKTRNMSYIHNDKYYSFMTFYSNYLQVDTGH